MKLSTLVSLVLLVSSTSLNAQDLTWPAGEGICTGSWTYTQQASCAYADDTNSPIMGTTTDISYVNGTCQNWDSYHVAETVTRSIAFIDSIVAPSPASVMPQAAHGLEMWVQSNVTTEGPWNGSCTSRNIFKKCTAHKKVRRVNYTFERRVANTTQSGRCAQVEVRTERSIPVGYNKLVGFHASCPGASQQKSGYFAAKSSITGPGVDTSNASCSTLDGTPASDDAAIRSKFDAYLNQAFELSAQEGHCEVKQKVADALSLIANVPGSNGATALTDDQFNLVLPTIDSVMAGCL